MPIRNLMEDAATAEICRAQLWQWRSHGRQMSDGRTVTSHLIRDAIANHRRELAELFDHRCLTTAAQLFEEFTTGVEFDDFLTLRAYQHLD